jgi:hypothetical protein
MKKREVASFTIFAGAVATLAYAMAGSVEPDPHGGSECRTRAFYPLTHGQSVEFIVTPNTGRFMLASLAVHPGRVPERQPVSYGLQVEWVDPDNVTVEKRSYYERSWFAPERSAPPSLSPLAPRLAGEEAWLADERFTYFPAHLPAGGTLRLSTLPGSGLVLVRLYFAAEVAPTDRSRQPDQPRQQTPSGNLHPAAWDDLDAVEAAFLSRHRWMSAAIRGRRGLEFSVNTVQLCDLSVPFADRPALTITLLPGRATALNFRHPVQVLFSGDTGLSSLSAHSISAPLAPDADPTQLDLLPAPPLLNLGFPEGAVVDLPAAGPTSLLLSNGGSESISFVASVEAPATTAFFGNPALFPLRYADKRFAGSEDVLVGPELRYLELHRIGADEPEPVHYDLSSYGSRDPIRLRVRALTTRSSGEVKRNLSVTMFDANNEALYSETHAIALAVTPFERALPARLPTADPKSHPQSVTDDLLLYVTNHRRGERLEVRSDRPVLVSASAEGAPRGDERRYPLPDNSTRVRFGEGQPTTWHRLLPTNHVRLRDHQTMRLEGVVRLARSGPGKDTDATGPASYALLAPESQTQKDAGRLYLVRETEVRRWPIEYYCSYAPGADQDYRVDEATWRHSRGLLKTVLWAPPAALGSHFRVLLDDRLWHSGLIRSRVTTGQRAAPNTADRVRLVGDPDVRLWLQAYGRRWPCRAPHRIAKAFPLAPGASASFAWHRTQQTRGILLTGFSNDPVLLQVNIDDGQPEYRTGLHEYATAPTWAAHLDTTHEQVQQLLSPDTALRRLSVNLRRIGDNIPMGEHRLTVKNLSPQSLDLRTLLQIDAPPSEKRDRPQWVRRDALEIW